MDARKCLAGGRPLYQRVQRHGFNEDGRTDRASLHWLHVKTALHVKAVTRLAVLQRTLDLTAHTLEEIILFLRRDFGISSEERENSSEL